MLFVVAVSTVAVRIITRTFEHRAAVSVRKGRTFVRVTFTFRVVVGHSTIVTTMPRSKNAMPTADAASVRPSFDATLALQSSTVLILSA